MASVSATMYLNIPTQPQQHSSRQSADLRPFIELGIYGRLFHQSVFESLSSIQVFTML